MCRCCHPLRADENTTNPELVFTTRGQSNTHLQVSDVARTDTADLVELGPLVMAGTLRGGSGRPWAVPPASLERSSGSVRSYRCHGRLWRLHLLPRRPGSRSLPAGSDPSVTPTVRETMYPSPFSVTFPTSELSTASPGKIPSSAFAMGWRPRDA